jgi:hypothetical protein
VLQWKSSSLRILHAYAREGHLPKPKPGSCHIITQHTMVTLASARSVTTLRAFARETRSEET